MMATIFLIRHGQASYGKADYDQLSNLGRTQSALLGHWFAKKQVVVNQVVTGTLRRQQQTAHSFFEVFGEIPGKIDGHIQSCFDEIDHHSILTLNSDSDETEIRQSSDYVPLEVLKERLSKACVRWMNNSGEIEDDNSFETYRLNLLNGIRLLGDSSTKDGVIAVFTSAGAIAIIVGELLKLPAASTAALMWQIPNTSFTQLTSCNSEINLEVFNAIDHLKEMDDETLVTFA